MTNAARTASYPFLYANGIMTNIPMPGGAGGSASAINDNGQVVGSYDGTSGYRAFLYSNGTTTDLGILAGYTDSYARGINKNGVVVGDVLAITGTAETDCAVLYSGGAVVNLNTLISPTLGWNLQCAYAINDVGQIVGLGCNSLGQEHAFLLTPVPEPSTLALLGIGAVNLLAYAWRKRTKVSE